MYPPPVFTGIVANAFSLIVCFSESFKSPVRSISCLLTIPVKTGGGYKFIYTDAEIARGKVLVYQEKFGNKAIEGSFERKSNEIENEQWGTRHIISFDLTLPEQPKRTFIISEYIPSSRTSPIVLMAFFEDLKKTFTIDYPTVEQVYTEQVLTVPSHLYY